MCHYGNTCESVMMIKEFISLNILMRRKAIHQMIIKSINQILLLVHSFLPRVALINGYDNDQRYFSDILCILFFYLWYSFILFSLLCLNDDAYYTSHPPQPQGAILTGPPGTGKTLLAKATAG